jgi:hypothetical protein
MHRWWRSGPHRAPTRPACLKFFSASLKKSLDAVQQKFGGVLYLYICSTSRAIISQFLSTRTTVPPLATRENTGKVGKSHHRFCLDEIVQLVRNNTKSFGTRDRTQKVDM